nr:MULTISPECIES: phage tail protein [unclassified Pseudomonas]
MRLYSKTTGCCYLDSVHGNIPDDARPIDEERYLSVIANPPHGKVRGHDSDGLPILIDPPPPPAPTREQIEAQRLRAYADPLIGSDRYFAEAQRESLLGNAEAAEAAKALGLARFAEIQAEYPWPAE